MHLRYQLDLDVSLILILYALKTYNELKTHFSQSHSFHILREYSPHSAHTDAFLPEYTVQARNLLIILFHSRRLSELNKASN